MRGNSTLEACDDDDDGITRFADIPSGSYVVRQIEPPAGGYTAAGSTATRLDPGQTATVTVVNEARPGSLVLRKTDDAGQLLAGACFALRSGDRVVYSICDNDASDANTSVGVILLGTVAPGTYTLRETQPPIGYLGAADQEVTISANQRSQVSVVNALAPEPQRTAICASSSSIPAAARWPAPALPLSTAEGQVLALRCDADDGADNGVVLMEGIAPGEYTLRETRRPSADYQTAADVLVEIVEDQTVDVEVVNRLHRRPHPDSQDRPERCATGRSMLRSGRGWRGRLLHGREWRVALRRSRAGCLPRDGDGGSRGLPRRAGHRPGHGQTWQHGDA